jgi:hypothetical protein
MSPDPETKFHYGPPEKTNWIKILLFLTFVIIGICGIVWMITNASSEKSLVCRSDAPHSLLSFGTCVEQQ